MYLKRLKELRKASNLTQLEVANLLHITKQQYGLYELGKRNIPNYHIKILSKYYNTSCDYILEETDEIEPYRRNH